jgi:hypothetical protein
LKGRVYRHYGSMLALVGMTMLLTYAIVGMYWLGRPITHYGLYNDPRTIVIRGFLPLGLILYFSGIIIRRIFREEHQLLTKDGETIHSGMPWYKSSESGLYLTSCGLMVSINRDSEETYHVGYSIVSAEQTTCRDCAFREGRSVLEPASYGRKEY